MSPEFSAFPDSATVSFSSSEESISCLAAAISILALHLKQVEIGNSDKAIDKEDRKTNIKATDNKNKKRRKIKSHIEITLVL